MTTREAHRRRVAVGVWITAMSVLNLFALYRTQQAAIDIRDSGDQIIDLQISDEQSCAQRAKARAALRSIILNDPDTDVAEAAIVGDDLEPIICP